MIAFRYLFYVFLGMFVISIYGGFLAQRDTELFNAMKERNETICKQFTDHPDCP